jgi:hypothetical protein
MDAHGKVLENLRWQADVTDEPLTAAVLDAAHADALAGGPTWDRLRPLAHLPSGSNLALRLAGAAHRLALAGDAPAYAAHLPTCGGDGDVDAARTAFVALMADDRLDLRPVQTNEPGRLAALRPAFAAVHQRTGLPLRLLELGSSGGLLLRRPDGIPIAGRRGCDANPLDPTDAADRLLLLSFVWAGDVPRFRRLEAALDAAAADPATVDTCDAGTWLGAQLIGRTPGVTTVVFHSIVWDYLSPSTKQDIDLALAKAARRADDEAPLAYVRFEPGGGMAETRVTNWPTGDEHLLATSGFHGQDVDWRGYPVPAV